MIVCPKTAIGRRKRKKKMMAIAKLFALNAGAKRKIIVNIFALQANAIKGL